MDNLAAGMQYIGLMALVGRPDRGLFPPRRRGPVLGVSRGSRRSWPKTAGAVRDATLIDVTLPLVPGMTHRLGEGIEVADVGCGSGHAVNLMAEAFPRFAVSPASTSPAPGSPRPARRPGGKGLANARFEERDAARLGEAGRFRLHHDLRRGARQARPDWCSPRSRTRCARAGLPVRGHRRLQQARENLDHPLGPFLYTRLVHALHDRLLADGEWAWAPCGESRPHGVMLAEAGFTSVEAAHLDGDFVNSYIIATKT